MPPEAAARYVTSIRPERPEVRCPCGAVLFDGTVIKSRVVRLFPGGGGEALCKRCKKWAKVPITYAVA